MRRSSREPLLNHCGTHDDDYDAGTRLHRQMQVDLEHINPGLVPYRRCLLNHYDDHDERADDNHDHQSLPLPNDQHHHNNDHPRAVRMSLSALLRYGGRRLHLHLLHHGGCRT